MSGRFPPHQSRSCCWVSAAFPLVCTGCRVSWVGSVFLWMHRNEGFCKRIEPNGSQRVLQTKPHLVLSSALGSPDVLTMTAQELTEFNTEYAL